MNSKKRYVDAMHVIESTRDPVWGEVKNFREDLGFTEVESGKWRIRRSSSFPLVQLAEKNFTFGLEDEFAIAEEFEEEED